MRARDDATRRSIPTRHRGRAFIVTITILALVPRLSYGGERQEPDTRPQLPEHATAAAMPDRESASDLRVDLTLLAREIKETILRSATADEANADLPEDEFQVWKELLAAQGSASPPTCPLEVDKHRIDIYVAADAKLLCKAEFVPSDFLVGVHLLTSSDYQSEFHSEARDDFYDIDVKAGADPGFFGFIHGDFGEVKKLLDKVSKFRPFAVMEKEPRQITSIEHCFGPFDSKTVTLSVSAVLAELSVEQVYKLARRYPVGLSALVVLAEGSDKFSIENDTIKKESETVAIDPFVGVHWYFAAFDRDSNGDWVHGRYFEPPLVRLQDRFSLVVGGSIEDFTESGFLGLAFEPCSFGAITFGWEPKKIRKLKAGYAVGDSFEGKDAPTKGEWDLGRFGGGLAIDTAAFGKIADMVP